MLLELALIEEYRSSRSCGLPKHFSIIVHKLARVEVFGARRAQSLVPYLSVQALINNVGANHDIGMVVVVGHRDQHGLVQTGAKRPRAYLPVEAND